jgi:hypothetical protein
VLCKNIDVHKLAPRKSQYLITDGDRGQSIMLKYALNVRDLALVEHAFEQLVSRFDLFLKRVYQKYDDPQRGLMILDKSSTEMRIQNLAREFKYSGHTWGQTKNYAEVPVFLDSKASRLIQLADLVAYAIFRNFEHKDPRWFDIIKNCFDAEGGVVHGLYVKE